MENRSTQLKAEKEINIIFLYKPRKERIYD